MGPNLGARSGAHALAVSGFFRCASHRTAIAVRLRPRWLSNVGNVAATWHGAPLRACEGTAGTLARCLRSWHWVRVQFPQPPDTTFAPRRLAGPKLRVPVYRFAVFGSPTCLSCYRFYGHFVGVYPNAQKHVVNRWSLCRIAHRFRLVKNGGRCPQSLRVPRVLVCSSRQLYRQPAPRRPLPRRGYN